MADQTRPSMGTLEARAKKKYEAALLEIETKYSWAAVVRLGDAERALADIQRAKTRGVKEQLQLETIKSH